MATEPKPATEDVKIDLFEDDDEFEEFEINEGTNPFPIFFLIIKVIRKTMLYWISLLSFQIVKLRGFILILTNHSNLK
jgi:hypothetical protein